MGLSIYCMGTWSLREDRSGVERPQNPKDTCWAPLKYSKPKPQKRKILILKLDPSRGLGLFVELLFSGKGFRI